MPDPLALVPVVQGLIRPVAPVAQVVEAHKEVVELIRHALEEGRDYGPMPGEKPKKGADGKMAPPRMVLFKAGAERLSVAFGAAATYSIVEKEIDHDRPVKWRKKQWIDAAQGRRQQVEVNGESLGLYRYVIRAQLVRPDGRVLGEGIGACSTLEAKYVDRPRECENTCLKMAEKRALVAAALGAFGLSDRFTQDVEEGPPPAVEAPRPQAAPRTTTGAKTGPGGKATPAQRGRLQAAAVGAGWTTDQVIAALKAECGTDRLLDASFEAAEGLTARVEKIARGRAVVNDANAPQDPPAPEYYPPAPEDDDRGEVVTEVAGVRVIDPPPPPLSGHVAADGDLF